MKTRQFNPFDAIRYAFNTTTNNIKLYLMSLWVYLGLYIALLLIQLIGMFLFFETHINYFILAAFSSFVVFFVSSFFMPGFIKMLLNLYSSGTANWQDINKYYYLAPQFFLGAVLYCLIVFGGMILFIFPGFYFAARFALWPYFFIDELMDIKDSFKESWRCTRNSWPNLLIIILISLLLRSNPLLYFLTMFFSELMFIFVYKHIAEPKHDFAHEE
jgi:hypothetical protein